MKNITKYLLTVLLTTLLILASCASCAIATEKPIDPTGHIHNVKDWNWEVMALQGFFTPDESNRLKLYQILLTLEYHGISESQLSHLVRNDENTGFELRFLARDGETYAIEVWPYSIEGGWTDFYMPATLLYQFIEEHPELCYFDE